MRKRDAILLATLAMIGGTLVFQAVTAKPPEPSVAIAGWPNAPDMRFECRGDQDWVIYTTGSGEVIEQPTGDPCYSRGWDANGDQVSQ